MYHLVHCLIACWLTQFACFCVCFIGELKVNGGTLYLLTLLTFVLCSGAGEGGEGEVVSWIGDRKVWICFTVFFNFESTRQGR